MEETYWQIRDRQKDAGCKLSCLWPCKQHVHSKAATNVSVLRFTHADIIFATNSGCEVCGSILSAVAETCACSISRGENGSSTICQCKFVTLATEKQLTSRLNVTWTCGEAELELGLEAGSESSYSRPMYLMRSPARSQDDMLDNCNAWYRNCVAEHGECGQGRSSKLPTRVLNLRESQSTGLIYLTNVPKSGQYAALSYMWGGMKPPLSAITLICNRVDRERGIHFTDFPQCYEDAVGVARKLELPYLWIDALCIIQDDQSDWDRESAATDEVFNRAAVLIVAAAANNVLESFLDRSKQTWLPPRRVEVKDISGVQSGLLVRQSRDHSDSDHDACANNAIDARGWCC